MGQIEKERLVLVLLDEINGAGRVVSRKLRLIRVVSHHLITVISRQVREVEHLPLLRVERPHVVRVRQAVILIETILQRQELMCIAQVPLSKDSRAITLLLQHLPDRHLIRMDTVIRTRSRSASETDTIRIAAGQQTGTRRSTNRLSRQEVCKTNAFRRHFVDIRSGISVSPIKRKIPVTYIIQIDQDDIRVISRHPRNGKGRGDRQKKKFVIHDIII